ncbi:MAG: IS110 family transposase [Vicingaceae bacterium]|nr:IS110 family transposase [Vicingaceae bacterium]
MEVTGVYHENCALFLYQQGFSVSIILANKAKRYLQSLGLKSKTDSIDAKGLAQMGAEQCLKKWQPLGAFFYKLRSLTRQHQNLQEMKTSVRNQIHALEHGMYLEKTVLKQLKASVKLIEKQLTELETDIKKALHSEPSIFQKVEHICKIKGVGILTVATILVETNGFELFENNKQLVSYAGYDVVANQSGKHTGKTRISKKGNSRIRRCLFMPAFCVVTAKTKVFFNLYQRTFEKHGIKMKSYVAVQKKLLTTIYALWKKNEAFDENYCQKEKVNIQVKEQELTSLLGSERAEKNSQTKSLATQGKHPVSDHSLLPLCKGKDKKKIKIKVLEKN